MTTELSQPATIAHINGNILGISGYYADNTSTQHVLVATHDGNLYEVHWNQTVRPTVSNSIAHFNVLSSITGFYSLDDSFEHAIASTEDGTLHELYFTQPSSVQRRDPLIHLNSVFPANGMASFHSPDDNLRHVIIANRNGNPLDITYNAQQTPSALESKTSVTNADIASFSGFFAPIDNSRHIIMALKNGDVYDIDYPDQHHVPATVGQNFLRVRFNEQVVNVTAFFSSDTNFCHIVVLTAGGILRDYSYNLSTGEQRNTQLTSGALTNIADITSYYTAYDGFRHAVFATTDGNLHEITYTSAG
ncbi:MAG: hypothetical protein NVS4B12_27460 [Ktedonobacteraceae bacterium]